MNCVRLSSSGLATAFFLFCGCGSKEPPKLEVPSRVKVAHIMFEKHPVPGASDVAAIGEAVRQKKCREQMVAEIRDEIRRGLASGEYQFDFKLTLLRERKGKK